VITVLFSGTTTALLRAIGGRVDGRPFFLGLALFVLGVAGLGFSIFPDIVPFRLTLWAAASSTLSHVFLLIGALIVTPVVLAYSTYHPEIHRGLSSRRAPCV
jgi:cytochrome d ubiquinol oxidase subunit II